MKKSKMPETVLSPLEDRVMRVVWDLSEARADQVRERLQHERDLKDSTIRTLLRRLEEKGVLEHRVEGRTYVYRARNAPETMAVDAVRSVVNRFCKGSVSRLLLGMADDAMVSPEELRELADRIEVAKQTERKPAAKPTRRPKN